jgi:hypothetical protein
MLNWDDDDFEVPVMPVPVVAGSDQKNIPATSQQRTGDDDWLTAAPVAEKEQTDNMSSASSVARTDDIDDLGKPPMMLVNLTVLSSGAIHNRHDPHSVNDPDKKRALSEAITAEFARYSHDGALLSAGTIRPCAQSVWPAALAELRRDYPGQFWTPIFPPKGT